MNEPVVIVDSGASVPKTNHPQKVPFMTKTEWQLLSIIMGAILMIILFITAGYHLAYFLSCKV